MATLQESAEFEARQYEEALPPDANNASGKKVDDNPDDEYNDSEDEYVVNALFLEDGEMRPVVVLPILIGLFLFTSSFAQNLCYMMTSIRFAPDTKSSLQFSSLVYTTVYLGPVVGLVVDLVRVFKERYRPVVMVASALLGMVCFIAAGIKDWENRPFKGFMMLCWFMEMLVMFVYVPMNAVVISYGNSVFASAHESSSRIGGLMAQAMVWRTAGTFLYSIVYNSTRNPITYEGVSVRTYMFIAASICFFLVAQIFFTFRKYYVDRREASLRHNVVVRFYRSIMHIRRRAVSVEKDTIGSSFMFILCFIFIYFALPDDVTNTMWQFNGIFAARTGVHTRRAISIVGSLGSVVGAAIYALWMYFAQRFERRHKRLTKTNPFQIILAGCIAHFIAHFIHFIGQWGSSNDSFGWASFLVFQAFMCNMLLRFAFMPTLSLAAMHAPRGFETTAFELYSVATTGGGAVGSLTSSSLMSSLGATVTGGYWKYILLCMFFRILPMLIAMSLPKHREKYIDWSEEETANDETYEPIREDEWGPQTSN